MDTDRNVSSTVDAAGNCVITLRSDNKRQWIVKQAGIEAPNVVGGATGNIYKNGNIITPFVATGDAPAGEPYPRIGPSASDVLTVEWAGATPGATCSVTFLYDDGVPA